MAEIETALPPTKQPSVVDHRERAATHSSIDEKAFPSHESLHQNRDDNPALETEDFSELYDPNVYGRAFRLNLTPH
jgi:hypothetical protein